MNQPLPYPERGSRSPARPNLAASCIVKRMRESKYYAGNALRRSIWKESQEGAAAPASAAWRTRSLDIEIGDWEILFEAIQTRLRLAAGVWLDVTLQAPSPERVRVFLQTLQTGMQLACQAA
ncbi:hypothetical protein [Polaromonas hydrogenivorans]|uniref:Uncharacterized protein n=1 Tax=Polaromonas hydrogenivorans TaxID=335476 RepID=A0AAU7M028_9BURK